jgi:hypothetical protein
MPTKPPKAVSKKIRVTPARRVHILDGDSTGGGHGPGRNIPGKSEFPASLKDDEIIDGITDIASDPKNYPGGTIPTGKKRVVIRGMVKTVETEIVVDTSKRQVVTGYPINVPRNR